MRRRGIWKKLIKTFIACKVMMIAYYIRGVMHTKYTEKKTFKQKQLTAKQYNNYFQYLIR